MRKWDRVVCNPPALPGWLICYYASYLLNYLPVIGVGKYVVGKSYFSLVFSGTSTILYPLANPLYPSTTFTASTSLNSSFSGNIYWLAAGIIWIGITFSQRYEKRKPNWMDLFYNLFGIHLFYLGIACGLQSYNLAVNASL
jgi:hypothetical protein